MTMIIITNVIPDHLQHEVLLLEDAHLIGQPLQLLSFRSLINLMIIIITCLLCVSDHFHHYSWKENPNDSATHHDHDHDHDHDHITWLSTLLISFIPSISCWRDAASASAFCFSACGDDDVDVDGDGDDNGDGDGI